MIIFIFLAILVVGLIWQHKDEYSLGASIMSIFSGIAVVFSIFLVFFVNINKNADISANNQRYESLMYQVENNLYDNDNDFGKKELMSEIQNWNEDLARGKEMQHDFWVGIYVPNIYDNFEFIEYKNLVFKGK